MKGLLLPIAFIGLLAFAPGCRIVVTDDNGGGGGGGYDDGSYDDGGGSYDDGSGGGGDDYAHDDGGYEPEPEAEPEPAPPPRRARRAPPPRKKARRTRSNAPRRTYVGGYRSQYRNLPDLGETKKYMQATGVRGTLDQGYMRGKWKCGAQGFIKRGAGKGKTVIDGHLEIKGNNWALSGCTVTGNVEIRGNNNNIEGLQVFGSIKVRGVGNKTP